MQNPTRFKQKLRSLLIWVLCWTQILPPQYLYAHLTATDDHVLSEGSIHLRFRVQAGNREEFSCHEVVADESGAFVLSIDKSLTSNERFLYLIHDDQHVGTLIHKEGSLRLIGFAGHNFILDGQKPNLIPGVQEYPNFVADIEGNLAIRGGRFNGGAVINSHNLTLQDNPWFANTFVAQLKEKCRIMDEINIARAQIETDEIELESGSFIQGQQLKISTKRGVHKGDVQVENLVVEGFDRFDSYGSFNSLLTGSISGKEYHSHETSQFFAGVLQDFHIDNYYAYGQDFSGTYSLLDVQTATFGSHYRFTGESIFLNAENSAHINRGAHFSLQDGGLLQSNGTLIHNGDISFHDSLGNTFPYHKYRVRIGGTSESDSFLLSDSRDRNMLQRKIELDPLQYKVVRARPKFGDKVHLHGKDRLSVAGRVNTSHSATYSSEGQFSFNGESSTRGGKSSKTIVHSREAFCDGLLESSSLLLFDIEKDLKVTGLLKAHNVFWKSGQGDLLGTVLAAIFNVHTDDDFKQHEMSHVATETSTIESQKIDLKGTLQSSEIARLAARDKARIAGLFQAKNVLVEAGDLIVDCTGVISAIEQSCLEARNQARMNGRVEGDEVILKADSIDIQGVITTVTKAFVEAQKQLNMSGAVSGDSVALKAEDIKSSGLIEAVTTAYLEAQKQLDIVGEVSGKDVVAKAETVDLNGVMQAIQTVYVDASKKFAAQKSSKLKGNVVSVKAQEQSFSGKTDTDTFVSQGDFLEFKEGSQTNAQKASLDIKQTIDVRGDLSGEELGASTKDFHLGETGSMDFATQATVKTDTAKLEGKARGGQFTVVGERIENTADVRTDNIHLEATEAYVDSADTVNHARDSITLVIPKNDGFNGKQYAGKQATFKLKSMDLFDLLDKAIAPRITADIGETDVRFATNFDLAPQLTLFAGSLTNEKRLTTAGDFKVSLQGRMDSPGSMQIGGEGLFKTQEGIMTHDVTAGGPLGFETVKIFDIKGMLEGKSVSVLAGGVNCEREVQRTAIYGGYRDVLGPRVGILARNGAKVEGTQWLRARGAEFRAKGGHLWMSSPDSYIGSQRLEEDLTWSDGDNYHHHHYLTHHKSVLEGDLGIELFAPSSKVQGPRSLLVLEGVDAYSSAGPIRVYSAGDLFDRGVDDSVEITNISTSKGGFFKGKKVSTEQYASSTFRPNGFNAKKEVVFDAEGENHHWAPKITSGEFVRIKSLFDKVFMHAGVSFSFHSVEKKSKGAAWFSNSQWGHSSETAAIAQIFAENGVEISGFKGIHVDVVGDYLNQAIERHLQSPETEWIKSLQGRADVDWNLVQEKYASWHYKAQGLTGPAAAVIAIAVSCATAGAGAELVGPLISAMKLGPTAAAALTASANAAVSSLASKAAVSIISNRGDLNAVCKELSSSDSIRSLAISIVTAGAARGLCEGLDINLGSIDDPQSLSDRIHESMLRAGVGSVANATVGKIKLGEALLDALRSGAADVAGGFLANEVGLEYKSEDSSMDYVTHKILHAAIGAGMGALSDDDAISGAIGATVGEMLGEAYREMHDKSIDDDRGRFEEMAREGTNLAKISAAAVAAFMKKNPNIAASTAENAVKENAFWFVIPAAIAIGGGYMAYRSSDYETPEEVIRDLTSQLDSELSQFFGEENYAALSQNIKSYLDSACNTLSPGHTSDHLVRDLYKIINGYVGHTDYRFDQGAALGAKTHPILESMGAAAFAVASGIELRGGSKGKGNGRPRAQQKQKKDPSQKSAKSKQAERKEGLHQERGTSAKSDQHTQFRQEAESSSSNHSQKKWGNYRAQRKLPRDDRTKDPLPDAEVPHTQLGVKSSRNKRVKEYVQAREWGYNENGKLVPKRDIDFTDHGRPQNHTNPHQHRFRPNSTGGTMNRDRNGESIIHPDQ